MSELTFIGLGLSDQRSISLKGLDLTRGSDCVFAEFYTGLMPHLDLRELEELVGKPIQLLKRTDVEEHAQERILGRIQGKKGVLLVPGDPMMATTHIDLRLRAEKAGIKTRVIPGASIFSAVCAATGLQAYRFGRTVTIPYTKSQRPPESPYDHIKANLGSGLHTLVLLDIMAEMNYYMPIQEGLEYLLRVDLTRKEKVMDENRLIVGVARAGADDQTVKTGNIDELLRYDFGGPPHCLIVPSRLHFMEAEALQVLTGAKPESLKSYMST
jgi:diphthine synthase